MTTIVLVTGGFDPLHSGHILYFKAARQLGDMLIVGLNSDEWLIRKKGRAFMPWNERLCVANNLSMVDEVYTFDDEDSSARHFIQQVRAHYPGAKLIFANGGDRTEKNIPEMDVEDDNLEFAFGVGGFDKANSSSWILEEWKAPKTERPWGYYRVLHEVPGTKVKELTIEPGQGISLQRHQGRSEYWHVTSGEVVVESRMPNGYNLPPRLLKTHENHHVPCDEWHRLINLSQEPCKIVEIQYGDRCEESDIERWE
jgi:cytidyltransferase-like protein